jgi:hypothetical protein
VEPFERAIVDEELGGALQEVRPSEIVDPHARYSSPLPAVLQNATRMDSSVRSLPHDFDTITIYSTNDRRDSHSHFQPSPDRLELAPQEMSNVAGPPSRE